MWFIPSFSAPIASTCPIPGQSIAPAYINSGVSCSPGLANSCPSGYNCQYSPSGRYICCGSPITSAGTFLPLGLRFKEKFFPRTLTPWNTFCPNLHWNLVCPFLQHHVRFLFSRKPNLSIGFQCGYRSFDQFTQDLYWTKWDMQIRLLLFLQSSAKTILLLLQQPRFLNYL